MNPKGLMFAMLATMPILASAASKEKEKSFVCKTCKDTGKVEIKCPVCRGTKYVWQCVEGKNRGWSSNYGYDEDGNWCRQSTSDGWCGYGSTYNPIHKNCKNTRKRIPCPNCISKSKTSSTGRTSAECPDCDGNGQLMKTYYVIRNVREIEWNREYIMKNIKRGKEVSIVKKMKMSKDELSDYKIENGECRIFESQEAAYDFIKDGEGAAADSKWYYVIRNAKRITIDDKRRALEGSANSDYGYSSENVLKRKFTDEEQKDFMALNPNCKFFRDVDEFKEFIRNAKPVADNEVPVRFYQRTESDTDAVVDSETNTNERKFHRRFSRRAEPVQKELSPEERQKLIDAEFAHDKEMFERKFGKERLRERTEQEAEP